MIIQRRSPISGKLHQMELDVTQDQLDRWKNGELIQRVMPKLSADEREFLISGITPTEWESLNAKEGN